MSREVHVRFSESAAVRSRRATQLGVLLPVEVEVRGFERV
jgi:hypothetical protein